MIIIIIILKTIKMNTLNETNKISDCKTERER